MATLIGYDSNGGIDANITNSTDLSITFPTTVVKGDILVLACFVNSSKIWSLPSGWTLISRNDSDSNMSTLVCFKSASGSESGTQTVSLTVATSSLKSGIIYRVKPDSPNKGKAPGYINNIVSVAPQTADINTNAGTNSTGEDVLAMAICGQYFQLSSIDTSGSSGYTENSNLTDVTSVGSIWVCMTEDVADTANDGDADFNGNATLYSFSEVFFIHTDFDTGRRISLSD